MNDFGKKGPPVRANRSLPELDRLHERHPGLSQAVCRCYAEAACVCMSRHHIPPAEIEISRNENTPVTRVLRWQPPSTTIGNAWKNADDATRDGAYSVSIATAESELSLVAISRAETRTGADYYLNSPGSTDLESAYRLEVSGLDRGGQSDISRRVREKIEQAQNGQSNLPAIVSVVGFKAKYIRMESVPE